MVNAVYTAPITFPHYKYPTQKYLKAVMICCPPLSSGNKEQLPCDLHGSCLKEYTALQRSPLQSGTGIVFPAVFTGRKAGIDRCHSAVRVKMLEMPLEITSMEISPASVARTAAKSRPSNVLCVSPQKFSSE